MYISFFQGDQGPRGQFGMMGRKGQRVSLLLRPEIKVVFSQENVTVVISPANTATESKSFGVLSYVYLPMQFRFN